MDRRAAFAVYLSSCWQRRWCCGRRAVLPARLDLDQDPQFQHVDADHARRGGGLCLLGGGHIPPGLFPEALRADGGHVPVYFEAAVVIIALVFVGQVLELRARERTGDAIKALIDLAPKTARRITPMATNTMRRWTTSSPAT
jgi:hypothetical protein